MSAGRICIIAVYEVGMSCIDYTTIKEGLFWGNQ
jgi:hypothetical protein